MTEDATPPAKMTFSQRKTQAIVGGLNLLRKYSDELMIEPAHDELFAGFNGLDEKMTEPDKKQMEEWGWHDENDDSFSIFT